MRWCAPGLAGGRGGRGRNCREWRVMGRSCYHGGGASGNCGVYISTNNSAGWRVGCRALTRIPECAIKAAVRLILSLVLVSNAEILGVLCSACVRARLAVKPRVQRSGSRCGEPLAVMAVLLQSLARWSVVSDPPAAMHWPLACICCASLRESSSDLHHFRL
jgi:hypothetical protein